MAGGLASAIAPTLVVSGLTVEETPRAGGSAALMSSIGRSDGTRVAASDGA
jgi:hypothetical protein